MKYAAALVLLLAPFQETEKKSWTVSLSSTQDLFRPGRPIPLTFTIFNPTDDTLELAEPVDFTEGLQITAPDGKVIKTPGKTKDYKRTHRSDGRGFIGRTVDVSSAFPKDMEDGNYTLRWYHGDAVSEDLKIFFFGDYLAELETNFGTITMKFFPELAPNHVRNFIELARAGFYDGTKFHRIIPGFMMQGGAPNDPRKKPSKTLAAEFSERQHVAGTVSMARTNDPNSASTEFFICFGRAESLDGKYTVFGQVIDGERHVAAIEKVKTDHNPCQGCGANLPGEPTQHCGRPNHHKDKPTRDVVLKKVKIKARKK